MCMQSFNLARNEFQIHTCTKWPPFSALSTIFSSRFASSSCLCTSILLRRVFSKARDNSDFGFTNLKPLKEHDC